MLHAHIYSKVVKCSPFSETVTNLMARVKISYEDEGWIVKQSLDTVLSNNLLLYNSAVS